MGEYNLKVDYNYRGNVFENFIRWKILLFNGKDVRTLKSMKRNL